MTDQLRLDIFSGLDGIGDEEDSRLGAKVEYLQTLAGGPEGYRLRRIILCNYWLYGLQEFEVSHGRLFLAGENASGKSSVLAAALPLALDGDLRPNRIDTFGGRDRKIEYYVLGGSESSTAYGFERRTTYIALEFEWCATDKPPLGPELRQKWLEEEGEGREKARWLTIGLCLAGNVNATERIRALRFVITDGSRFGHELHMVDSKNFALDHPAFRRALGEHGVICETTAEYQSFVARYLFGMQDVKEFQNIMSMLLVLRRPNLGSELNFSKVHDYLKQSLRKIPEETTRRVTGTIERIDNIQSQLERLQEAWDAAGQLDRAAQKLALAAAQKAGLSFARARNVEIAALGRVTSLRRELAAAEAERDTAQALYDNLTAEEGQVSGQITALESSEGLQVAERLAAAREAAQQATTRLEQQTEQLEGARQAVRAALSRQERVLGNWRKLQGESLTSFGKLRQEANDKAEWPLAAAQLEEALTQMSGVTLEAEQAPRLPTGLEGLAGVTSAERVERLLHLEELHRQREARANDERVAREREEEKLGEYDLTRQRYEAAGEAAVQARESLATSLRQLYKAGKWVSELPEYRFAQVVSAAQRETLSEYREVAGQFSRELENSGARLRQQQARLLENRGAQQRHKTELEELYRQRQAEPDLQPLRTTRREAARARLQVAGVSALPLYALVDFKAGIEANQAGQVERMLWEAGLLDALVLPPAQQSAATAILQAEGLSDSWLQPTAPLTAPTLADWLVFDAEGGNSGAWQQSVEAILNSISLNGLENASAKLDKAGNWQHGLLSGYSGTGDAEGFIGTANRRRLRRRELDELQARIEAVSTELEKLNQQLEQNQREQEDFSQEQAQLKELAQAGGVAATEAERDRAEAERARSEKTLQETQGRAREMRQQLTALTTRILQESSDIPCAANDPRRVRQLLDATRKLQSGSALLWQSLQSVGGLWQEYQESLVGVEAARRTEQLAVQLHKESLDRSIRASAELEELERAAQTADVQELIERLARLRQRRQELPEARMDARSERDRADERSQNLNQNLTEATQKLSEDQERRTITQNIFAFRLVAYPVPRLTEARLIGERDDYYKAALKLFNSTSGLASLDDNQLEADYTRAFNHLSAEFNRLRPVLAEYGPELDDEGRITFILENRIEPPGLVETLEHQIEVQKTLLGNEERALFEDFLLQEMAESIRFHIGQTEIWVRSINRVLEDLPMVGEHYALEWKPADESSFLEGLGSHIARQHRLLRKPAQQLSVEERQVLMDAFRREIEGLRLLQKEQPGLNFMDSLVQIFDYREWFHFSVFITPIGGSRIRMTDRIAGTRSGAEQLFALYVPLFAALAALYDSAAAPGCPRLLALDEAFDKASMANTQRIMEFLVLQGFQWIMTGPQVSGTGSGVPVSAEYQMMHEKGTLIATAVPFFWIAGKEVEGQESID